MTSISANLQYRELLDHIYHTGVVTDPRGQSTREVMNHQTCVDMTHPAVTLLDRKLNYKFMVAEAVWILSGSNKVGDLTPYCKRMIDFSDDGVTLSGAYGPKYWSQASYVVDMLRNQPNTRQAVMSFWRQNPTPSKDIPCTSTLQFLIREGHLHLNIFMRSSDVWLGWPYDVFSFSMMAAHVALHLENVKLGDLTITAGSQHLYDRDMSKIFDVIKSEKIGRICHMSLYGLKSPEDLICQLRNVLNDPNSLTIGFFKDLSELCNGNHH